VAYIIFLTGCNSTTYDIIEVEEVVTEPVSKKPDTIATNEFTSTDIKQDLKPDSKLNETSLGDKQLVSKSYTVQIGAFINESNAVKYLNSANKKIPGEFYYKQIEGLFKIRIGNYNQKSEAYDMLEKLHSYGFSDSFIIETKYYQLQPK